MAAFQSSIFVEVNNSVKDKGAIKFRKQMPRSCIIAFVNYAVVQCFSGRFRKDAVSDYALFRHPSTTARKTRAKIELIQEIKSIKVNPTLVRVIATMPIKLFYRGWDFGIKTMEISNLAHS